MASTGIKIEREKEYEELKAAVARSFSPENVEKLLKRMQSKGVTARNVQGLLEKRVIESVDEVLGKSKQSSRQLYDALSSSDQGQMREFYLSQAEKVSPELRTKFKKLYQYY